MNNQLPMHPTYTLPGVMHYLQTEFTKNERDRISWELERSEMKARIAQLEGENKDLRYRLMKLDPNSEPEIYRPLGESGASPLVRSKAAVQENVKEIIYLFKSPNLGSQIETLNEKRDPVHELEKLGFNQSRDARSQQHLINHNDGTGLSEIGNRETNILQDTSQHEDLSGSKLDERSDADTVIVGSDNEPSEREDTVDFPKRHRSSSLFTSEKVKPLENREEELPREERISLVQGTSDRSGIVGLKVHGNQVIAYSKSDELNYRCIGNSLNWEDQYQKFEGLTSTLFDIFWLDNEKFLTLDREGLKLWKTTIQSGPVANIELFGETLQHDQLSSWDFKNSWLLLALKNKLYLNEILISADSSTISLAKNYYFNTNKQVLDAKFGMTEKSLIILNKNSDEIDIYNFQGKQLQKIDMKKFFPPQTQLSSEAASLYLNKRSSKLLILIQELLLVYSFDQKKVILKQVLGSQPTSLIFSSSKDNVVLAYDDGYIEVRNIKLFNSIIKRYNHVNDEVDLDENTQSLMHSGLKPMDRNPIILQNTEIDDHKIIISADGSGRIRLNEIQELEDGNYEQA